MVSIQPIKEMAIKYNEALGLIDPLQHPSLYVSLNTEFQKSLFVACGSWCEATFISLISRYVDLVTDEGPIKSLVKKKALDRQFFRYIHPDDKEGKGFLSFFGDNVKALGLKDLKADGHLGECRDSFFQLCQIRDELLHREYYNQGSPNSIDEIVEKLVEAEEFTQWFFALLRRKT